MTKVLVTGGDGFLAHAVREILPDAVFATRRDGDLTQLAETEKLFDKIKPQAVLHLAAEVGGVKMNAERNADMFALNAQLNVNVLQAAQKRRTPKLFSILSSCAYPETAGAVMSEDDLHSGMPFAGNLGYGFSKRMLDLQTRMVREQDKLNWFTITPVTMFGPHDDFSLETGHVAGALMRKCFSAKKNGAPLEVWGTGKAVRQFVYVRDVARLLVQILSSARAPEAGNVIMAPDDGISIGQLAEDIAHAFDFKGPIKFDTSKPEGQMVRVIKSKHFRELFPDFKFTPREQALKATAEWFEKNQDKIPTSR